MTLKDEAQQQIAKTMTAHLHLLINIYTNNMKQTKNWKKLPNGEIVAKKDLSQGKIVVRTLNKGEIHYTNIRNTIEKLETPQLLNYNIGIGTASTRTTKQKELAKQYTKTILDNAADNIILVDGSINTKDNTKPPKQQKLEQSGFGGYGGIWINKRTKQIKGYFKNTINTNDAQKAEIQGIAAALQTIKKTKIKDFTILCDCKNAVKYSNKTYKVPTKYAKQIQQIYTKITENNKQGTNITIDWIPGHTGNKWNELADKIAKAATKDWLKPNTSTDLVTTFLPFIRALDISDVRNPTQKRENGID